MKHLSHDNISAFFDLFEPNNDIVPPWTAARIDDLLNDFYDGRTRIRLDPDARNNKHCQIKHLSETNQWRVHQTLCDPDEINDWELVAVVDLQQSNERNKPVIQLEKLGCIV